MTKLVIKVSATDRKIMKGFFDEASKAEKEGKTIDVASLTKLLTKHKLAPYAVSEENREIKFIASKITKA